MQIWVGSCVRGWPAQLWMGTAATHTLVGERAMEATVRLPWYRSATLVKPVATASGGLRPGVYTQLGGTRSIIETHIHQERYCVKLLGVGRGDAVAAWPSQDRTPLNEPFERLVSDHHRPETVYVLPSDSVLLHKVPPCEPKSDLANQNQQFRNKQTNTRPIFSPLLGGSPTTKLR